MLRPHGRCQREHHTPNRLLLLQPSKPAMISADTLIVMKTSMDIRVLEVNDMTVIEAITVVTTPNLADVTSNQM